MFIVVASFSYFKCKYSSADQTLCNQSNILLPLKQKTHLSCLNFTSKRCNTKFRDYFSQSVISNTNTVAFFVFHKTYKTIMNESVESLITNCFDIWHIFPLM
jgi:hypothetical protein